MKTPLTSCHHIYTVIFVMIVMTNNQIKWPETPSVDTFPDLFYLALSNQTQVNEFTFK